MKYKNKLLFCLISLILLSDLIISIKQTTTLAQNSSNEKEVVLEIPLRVTNNKVFISSLTMNQTLVIKIHGNPTTGYGWYLENYQNLNSSGLNPLNLNEYGSTDEYKTDPHPAGFVGVPGSYYFRFQPIKSQVSLNLVFINKRPWMPEEDVKRVVVTVNIAG